MALQYVASAIKVLHQQAPHVNGFAVLQVENRQKRCLTASPTKTNSMPQRDLGWIATDDEYEELYGPQCFSSSLRRCTEATDEFS